MSENATVKWGSEEHLKLSMGYLRQQTYYLHLTNEALKGKKGEVPTAAGAFLWSAMVSCQAFEVNGERADLSSGYVMARVVLETVINGLFVCSEGDSAARKARKHAEQKMIRGMRRELLLSDGKILFARMGTEEIWDDPKVKELLDEYTGKKGQEIKQWTPHSVLQRIEKIEKKFGAKKVSSLRFALFSIYRDASEVIHGTYYGTLVGLGGSDPGTVPTSEEEWFQRKREHFGLLYHMLGNLLGDFIYVLGETTDDRAIIECYQQSKRTREEYVDAMSLNKERPEHDSNSGT